MKKIAIITNDIDRYGGIQRVVTNLANQLCLYRYEVSIFVGGQQGNKSIYELNDRCNVTCLNYNKSNMIHKLKKTICYIFKPILNDNLQYKLCFSNFDINDLEYRLKDFDIVIANSGDYSALISNLDINGKKIGVQHNSFEIYYNQYFKRWIKLYLRLYNKLDKLVVLNDVYKKSYENTGLKNVITIPNFSSYKTEQINNLDKKIILCAGRMANNEAKGFDLLIESFKYIYEQCPEWELHIYGEGPMKNIYRDVIEKYKLEKQIKIYDFTNNLSEKMLNSSIYALSSRWEGFPMVALEAMECGLPIVSFDIDAIKGVIIQNENGLLANSYDTKEFAKNILKLINNKNLLTKCSTGSKDKVKQFYPENIMKMWIDIIEQ